MLIALLYADGQERKHIALQLGCSINTIDQHLRRAKGHLLGDTGTLPNGASRGVGTRMQLRAVLVEDGWLTEAELVS